MSRFDDPVPHPRAEDIQLSPANDVIRTELINRARAILSSEVAVTYEVTDTTKRTGLFALPFPRYLARAAIMKLDLVPENPISETSSDIPLYQVAIVGETHQLDKEKIREISAADVDKLGFVWPDGIKFHFLDNRLNNLTCWGTTWQTQPNEFSFNGSKTGFKREAIPSATDAVLEAAGVTNPDSWLDGPGITDGGLEYFAEIRAIHQVLDQGQADIAAIERLVDILETRDSTEHLSSDLEVLEKIRPHFGNLISSSFDSPRFRNMLAWQQYCEQTWGSATKSA